MADGPSPSPGDQQHEPGHTLQRRARPLRNTADALKVTVPALTGLTPTGLTLTGLTGLTGLTVVHDRRHSRGPLAVDGRG